MPSCHVAVAEESSTNSTDNWVPYGINFVEDDGSLVATTDEFTAVLPGDIKSGDGVQFNCGGHWFNYKLSGGKIQWRYMEKDNESTKSIGAVLSSSPVYEGNNATYYNAFWGTDIRYTAHSYGLREVFILDALPTGADPAKWTDIYLEYTGELSWDDGLSVWADGVEHPDKTFSTSGRIDFKDSSGEIVFYIPEPTAWDSDGNTSYLVYDVKVSADKIEYGLRVPYEFLESAVYPVYIDPDNWVSPTGASGTDWVNHSNTYDNDTGTCANSNDQGSYIELTISAIVCDKVRIYAERWSDGLSATLDPDIDIDVYYDSAWHNIFSGTVTKSTWVTKTIGSTEVVTKAQVKCNDALLLADAIRIYEFDFNSVVPEMDTQACSDVDGSSFDANGEILTAVASSVTTRGFHYSKVFDDFEWGSDGDPLTDDGGAIDWTLDVGGSSIADIDTSQHYSGTRSALLQTDGSNSAGAYFSQSPISSSQVISVRVRKDNTSRLLLYHGDGISKLISTTIHNDERVGYRDSSGTWVYLDDTVSVGEWHSFQITNADWTAGTFDIYLDGILVKSGAEMSALSSHGNAVKFWNYYNPGASDLWLDEVAVWDVEDESGTYSEGTYDLPITSLDANTEYFVQAFGKNSVGYGYGDVVSQLTAPAAPTDVAATDGVHTDKVAVTWTKSDGAAGYKVYRDGGLVDTLGDVATYDDTGADAGTIGAGVATASDGGSTAHTTLTVTGETSNNGTSHTYKVVAFNDGGDSADSGTDTGYRGIGELTYQWYRSSGTGDSDFGAIGGATTDPYDDTAAPAPAITPGTAVASDGSSTADISLSIDGESANVGESRYYYCTLSATGAESQDTAHDDGYRDVGALTYQWQRSSGDSDGDYGNLAGATTESHNDDTAPAPSVTAGNATATDGTSASYVTLNLINEQANDGDGRYYQCVLNADGATEQTTGSNRGYRGIDDLTYQWYRSAGDVDGSYSTIAGATSVPYNDTDGVIAPDGRYYLCQVDMTDATAQNSTSDRGFKSATCDPPGNFTITQIGPNSANITWDMGDGSNTTIIRVSTSGYPDDCEGDYEVYSGNGTWVVVDGLDLDTTTYYYSAWGHNAYGCSDDYATARIGGSMALFICFTILGLGLTLGFFWKRNGLLAYGASGAWALLGFEAFQLSGGTSPTDISDTYMALFWLCIAFVIGCALLPTVMREKPEKGEIYADTVDEVGDDLTSFISKPKEAKKQ
jgi:hypothetical protein